MYYLGRCTIILDVLGILGAVYSDLSGRFKSVPAWQYKMQSNKSASNKKYNISGRQCKIVEAMMEWSDLYCQKLAYLHDGVHLRRILAWLWLKLPLTIIFSSGWGNRLDPRKLWWWIIWWACLECLRKWTGPPGPLWRSVFHLVLALGWFWLQSRSWPTRQGTPRRWETFWEYMIYFAHCLWPRHLPKL